VSEDHSTNYLENAVLDSMHTSATETVLQWPHFNVFPALRDGYISIFQLEQARMPVRMATSQSYPYVATEDIERILSSFEHTVNFWYPTMSRRQLDRVRTNMTADTPEEDVASVCLALLTMALGCASHTVAGLTSPEPLSDDDLRQKATWREMGDAYFNSAMTRLPAAHTGVSSTATHCLFFVALYFAFLRRPLQAWDYINSAATKCLLLISYPPLGEIAEDQERIRRIFWSCYVLER